MCGSGNVICGSARGEWVGGRDAEAVVGEDKGRGGEGDEGVYYGFPVAGFGEEAVYEDNKRG